MADGKVRSSVREVVKDNQKGSDMAEEQAGLVNDKGFIGDDRAEEYNRIFDPWQPTWFDIGAVKFAAFGDRLLIREDEFRSGYECRICNGSGKVECATCSGRGSYRRDVAGQSREFKCSSCA